jgi:hypothetical protein
MKIIFLSIFIFIFIGFVQAQNTGSVCVRKLNAPTAGEKSLGNPTGGESFHKYKIQIDNKIVSGSYDKSVKIAGLSVRKKHFIKIFQDGNLIQSFGFRFGDEFNSPKLCLWLKDLYQTWQLWEASKSISCSCK